MREIWLEMERLLDGAGEGALVTVASTKGSAYQREGARLLYRPDGEAVGTVSGGCLETDLFERCHDAIRRGRVLRARYDTGAPGEIVFGSGTGCGGEIEVLIEPLSLWRREPAREVFTAAVARVRAGRPFVLAGPLPVEESERVARFLIDADGTVGAGTAEPALVRAAGAEAEARLATGRRRPSTTVAIEGGALFLDVCVPPIRLVVFGADADARPLVRLAAELDLATTVADWREPLLDPARLPGAEEYVRCRPEELVERVPLGGNPAVVLMSHNYLADRAVLASLLRAPDRLDFIGALGPRRRTEQMLAEIAAEGPALDPDRVAAIRSPVGLDVGADSPAEIALAILGEVLAIRRRCSGGALRDTRAGGALALPRPSEET